MGKAGEVDEPTSDVLDYALESESNAATANDNASTGANGKSVSAHSRRIVKKTHVKTALPIVDVTVTETCDIEKDDHLVGLAVPDVDSSV